MSITFVDLFCGGGFGARGAVRAGATPILGIDSWALAIKTYQANFPDAEVINAPIETINPYQLAEKFNPDVLLTSPECTAHSIARGANPGSEKSRETALGIFPWIKAMNPRWVIVENVNRMKKWDRHNELVLELENYGYKVNDLLLNSADFGTPQARKRMFLICDQQGTSITSDSLLNHVLYINKNVKSIIDWSGRYKSNPLYTEKRAKATLQRAERAINTLGKNIPFIIVYYGSDYAGGWQSIDAPLRTVTTIDRFGLVTWHQNTPFLRMLQPSELLQAMGAGKEHNLSLGTRRDKVKLCGNGVCSPVLEAIFKKINKVIANEKSISNEKLINRRLGS